MSPRHTTKCARTFSRPGTLLSSPSTPPHWRVLSLPPAASPCRACSSRRRALLTGLPAESLLAASARAPWLTQGDVRPGLAAPRLC